MVVHSKRQNKWKRTMYFGWMVVSMKEINHWGGIMNEN